MSNAGLRNFGSLHTLEISSCPGVTDVGIVGLTSLRTLEISRCPGVTDVGIGQLTTLHRLSIRDCRLVADGGLSTLTQLHKLDIADCAFRGTVLATLFRLRELSWVVCDRKRMEGLHTDGLWTLRHLRRATLTQAMLHQYNLLALARRCQVVCKSMD